MTGAQNAVIYIRDARVSFSHIIEPKTGQRSDGSPFKEWRCDLIIDQENPAKAEFLANVVTLAKLKWKEHAENVLTRIKADRRYRCFGEGGEFVSQKTFKPYNGYDGKFIVTAINGDSAPTIFGQDGVKVDQNLNSGAWMTEARRIHDGYRVNVAVSLWLQDNSHGRGVRAKLLAIQFAREDQLLGSVDPDVSSGFGAIQGAAPPSTGFSFS